MKPTFSIRHLVKSLQEAGLPSTRPSIWSYEKKGIIKLPKMFMQYGQRRHRLYTEKEIKVAVESVRKYRQSKTRGTNT